MVHLICTKSDILRRTYAILNANDILTDESPTLVLFTTVHKIDD